MDIAVKFYTEKLGFELTNRFGDDWAEFDAGGFPIGLHGSDGEPIVQGGGGTISFTVEDIEKTVSTLKERGVEVSPIRTPDRGKFAMAKDIDGNQLHIVEFKREWMEENKYRT